MTLDSQVAQLTNQVNQLQTQLGNLQLQLSLTNPSGNYAPATDQFNTAAGSLISSLMNFNGPFGLGADGGYNITGLSFTPNSPGAGSIAWSACVLTFQGTQYVINPGSSGTNFWIYWQVSNPNVFQTAAQGTPNIPTLGIDDFIIALNNNHGNSAAVCIDIHDSIANHRLILNSDSVFFINSSGKVVADLGIASSQQGIITLWNAAQAAGNTIVLDPSVPQITVGGTAITVP